MVPITDPNGHPQLIKYGVIQMDHLIDDLLDWNYLYIAGRLHKPVKIVQVAQNNKEITELLRSITINHQSALYAALLLLEENFSEEQLYFTLANLSYSGDFRMTFGEDKQKVEKIVRPNLERFRQIYQPHIKFIIEKGLLSFNPETRMYCQDCSCRVILHNLSFLPKQVQHNLCLACDKRRGKDLDDILVSISRNFEYSSYVRAAIDQIVHNSSWTQSAKGVLTAGIIKSIKYSASKIKKMNKS